MSAVTACMADRSAGRFSWNERSGKSCRGITLVEVLVALAVLSVGVLGLAMTFAHSVRSSHSALLRTQAVLLVGDLGDRIRANAGAGAAYDLASYGGAPAPRGCSPTADDEGRNCSIAQLAEDDLARWLEAVRESLPPPGDGVEPASVVYEPGKPDRYRITLRWREPGEPQVLVYQAELLLMPRPPVAVSSGS